MPIPRDLFDKGIDDIDQEIFNFLSNSSDEAFSLEELADAVGIEIGAVAEQAALDSRLEDLEAADLIESRNIHGIRYFSIA